MESDRIDIHNNAKRLRTEMARLTTDLQLLPEQRQAILRFVGDAKAGRIRTTTAKKRVSDVRCLKLIYVLRRFGIEIGVPFERVTPDDMEKFIFGLEDGSVGKLASRGTSSHFSHETVRDFKKIIRRFYRYLVGHDTERCYELTGWFDTSETMPELTTFGLDEARRIAFATGSRQGRAIVMVLMDSGARPGELFNVRLGDLSFQPDPDGELIGMMRIRHSKTSHARCRCRWQARS